MNQTIRPMIALALVAALGCGQSDGTVPTERDDPTQSPSGTPDAGGTIDSESSDAGGVPDLEDGQTDAPADRPDAADDAAMKPDEPPYLGEWYRGIGAGGAEWGRAVAVDDAGNAYVAGTFDDEMTVGGVTVEAVPGEFETRQDAFVASFDSAGEFRWIRSFGSPEHEQPKAVVVDEERNVYVVGDSQGPLQFDDTTVDNLGQSDVFLVSFDTEGTFRWGEAFGGPYSETPTAAAINDAGELVITGSYQGLFTAGDHTLSSMNDWAAMEVFTMRYDTADRAVDWVTGFSGFLIDTGTAVGIADDGSAVVGVSLQYDLRVDDSTTFEVGEEFACAIVSLDTAGGVAWSELLQGEGAREVTALDVTPDGNVHATGVFEDDIVLGDTTLQNSSTRAHDTWVARFESGGEVAWARGFGADGFDQPLAVGQGRYGVYVAGRFDETIAFDSHELDATDGYDVFVASLDTMDGGARWARAVGGEGDDQPNGLQVDSGRGVYVSGYASGRLMFNDQPQPDGGESIEAFLLRLEDP